jgi:hypothetical protein
MYKGGLLRLREHHEWLRILYCGLPSCIVRAGCTPLLYVFYRFAFYTLSSFHLWRDAMLLISSSLTLCTVFRLFVHWLKPNSMLAYIGADVVV